MTRVAVPSKGRLREATLDLLGRAGYRTSALSGSSASAVVEDIQFIEMRPTDAAAWLAAGRLDAAFISTDTALENGIEDWPSVDLGFSRSDMVVACRQDAPFASAKDLSGKTVATHLARWTARWFAQQGIEDVTVVSMGGSLEGICARGMADAIVDLRETGSSLAKNSLHAIEEIIGCQAKFAIAEGIEAEAQQAIDGLVLRIEAARLASHRQYLVLHIDRATVPDLAQIFPGLAAPTVLPLAGEDDLVAVHLVVKRDQLWHKLPALRALGATGIVALPADAIVE